MKSFGLKALLLLLSLLNLGNTADFSAYNCRSCANNNGVYCLALNDFNQGICCDPTYPSCSASNQMYCVDASKNTITNTVLRKFVCP